MNRRQKKKQYKKQYSHNPPKHKLVGAEPRADCGTEILPPQIDIQAVAEKFSKAMAQVARMVEQYEQPTIEQREAPIITAEALVKRRKERCGIRQWKVFKKWIREGLGRQ